MLQKDDRAAGPDLMDAAVGADEYEADDARRRGVIWLLSELYYPEVTSTGHVMTEIAEGLADGNVVGAICAQPTYSLRGVRAPTREHRRGVDIQRCWSSRLDKNRLPLRIINACTIAVTMAWRAAASVRNGDTMLVVTNPPILPLIAALVARLRRARLVLLIHDVYPDVIVATRLAGARAIPVRVLRSLMGWLYARADNIVVVGRDMAEVIGRQADVGERIVVIPNWAELDRVVPTAREDNQLLSDLGLQEKFVVQYAGNLGRPNDVGVLVECAALLRDDHRFHLMVIGAGVRLPELQRGVAALGLGNVTILGPLPRDRQVEFLNACDVAVHTFVPGMFGLGVPSRMYNVMAAGKPLVAVVDPGSEPARVVEEHGTGWVVMPGDAEGLAEAVREAMDDREALSSMGRRARAVAESDFNRDVVMCQFRAVLNGSTPAPLQLR
jgi:colanic acid biosynthesis glycosyl transferase WcaI